MGLDRELAVFAKLKAELIANHNGKFVLIKGDDLIDTFDNADNAYQEGVQRFGRESFLVKRVGEVEEVYQNHALYSGLMNANF